MSGINCPKCHSNEIETDSSRGETCCTKCGSVIDDRLIVSEVQFEEGAHGASHVVGRHVSDSGFKGLSVSGIIGAGKESRQVTLDRAKKNIRAVATQLRLNSHCVDTAFNFYKMALSRRLTHGRKQTHVIAACIYITCRIERTSHMLLDLSDVMQVSVFDLGRTYLRLSSAFSITIKAIDPCLYISRFAHKLEFGKKTHEVEMTAMRIVQRMKRDWMHTGRRPSGLCGAALLVASRLNFIHCTVKDVIKVVKVCETTIRKRLAEFGETPSSRLTLDEFMTIDLEGSEDPPCYKASRRSKNAVTDAQKLEEIEAEIEKLQKQIEIDLEKSKKKLKGPWAKYARESSEFSSQPNIDAIVAISMGDDRSEVSDDIIANEFITNETVHTVNKIIDDVCSEESSFVDVAILQPTAASLGLNDLIETAVNTSFDQENNASGELDLTGISEDELDTYILSPSEIIAKTSIWMKMNAEYLKEVEEKLKRKQEEEAERLEKEASGEIQPKKKRKVRKKPQIQANSAGEAIEKMLQEKRISSKINYDVLRNLSQPGLLTTQKASVLALTDDETGKEEPASLTSSFARLPSMRNIVSGGLPNTSSLFTRLKRSRPVCAATDPPTKAVGSKSVQGGNRTETAIRELSHTNDPANVEDLDNDDDDDGDDYEEEIDDNIPESQQFSITQLMNNDNNNNYDDGFDDEDDFY